MSDISSTFGFLAFGFILGGIGAGFFLDHISCSNRYLFISFTLLMIGLSTMLLPHCPSLLAMQVTSGVFGLCIGAFNTGSNVLILDIWKNKDSSPVLYMMHFTYAIGGLIAPIIAKPFLHDNTSNEHEDADDNKELFLHNKTSNEHADTGDNNVLTVKILYPIVGFNLLMTVPAYIYYSIKEASFSRQEHESVTMEIDMKEEKDVAPKASKLKIYCLIILMTCYYLLFAGIESSFRAFTATFAVTSSLQLTRHHGSDIQAVFYSTWAIGRFIIIFLSKFITPTITIWISTTLLILGAMSLSIWAEESPVYLKIGVAFAGAGVASMFASGLLWFKECHHVSNGIGSVFIVSCGSGMLAYTAFIGHFIESHPMVFPHIMTGSVAGLGIIFGIANLLKASMRN